MLRLRSTTVVMGVDHAEIRDSQDEARSGGSLGSIADHLGNERGVPLVNPFEDRRGHQRRDNCHDHHHGEK